MKLVTFDVAGKQSGGILLGDDGTSAAEPRRGQPPTIVDLVDRYGSGVLGFVEHAGDARPAADEIVQRFEARRTPSSFEGRPFTYPLGAVTLRSPLPRPPSMRDGYAFRQHVETARKNRGLEMIPEFDQFPVFYFTNHQAVVGPGDVHVQRLHLDRLDFELEAAIVVGTARAQRPRAERRRRHLRLHDHERLLGARAPDGGDEALPRAREGEGLRDGARPWLVTVDELASSATRQPTKNGLSTTTSRCAPSSTACRSRRGT
jgi:hypothetical protein